MFFTSLPVIALGVFDQDVSARYCLKVCHTSYSVDQDVSIYHYWKYLTLWILLQFPILYQEGIQNVLFSWRRIIGWMLNGVCSAAIIFFICITTLDPQAFDKNGKTGDYSIVGATMYTCVVWVVNCQMALAVSYFTLIQHIFIWGGIALWYIFLVIYGAMPTTLSTNAYQVFVEALVPSALYWLVTLLVVVSALAPYFTYEAIQFRFFPMYHGMIQWIRYEGNSNDPEFCNDVRQRSIRLTTVGFTARLIARSNSSLKRHEWYSRMIFD